MTDPISHAVESLAKRQKEQSPEESLSFLAAVRAGRVVALLAHPDPNTLLRNAAMAGAAYGADALAIVLEGVIPLVPANPVTGEPWGRGEAETVWFEHDGVARGWVTETILISVGGRDGDTVDQAVPFRPTSDSIEWAAEPTQINSPIGGLLVKQLEHPAVDAARVPDPGDGFAGDPENGPFYDAAVGRQVLDIGFTRTVGRELFPDGMAMLLVATDAEAEALIDDGLPSWQVEVSGE